MPWAARAEVKLGNEVLAVEQFKVLQGKRIGLITNPSGVNRHLDATVDVLRAAPGVKLAALFGPEHGIYGDVPAGDGLQGAGHGNSKIRLRQDEIGDLGDKARE